MTKPVHRFLTVESNAGVIKAYTTRELFQQAIDDPETANWIWQFAADKPTAIKQHRDRQIADAIDGCDDDQFDLPKARQPTLCT